MSFVASPDRSPVGHDTLEKRAGSDNDKGTVTPEEARYTDGVSTHSGEDILALQDLDPAMNMKMHLVNNVSEAVVLT